MGGNVGIRWYTMITMSVIASGYNHASSDVKVKSLT